MIASIRFAMLFIHHTDSKPRHQQTCLNFAILFFLFGLSVQTTLVFSSGLFDDTQVECGVDCLLEKATHGMQEVSTRAPSESVESVGCSLRENLGVFEYSWQIGFMIACYTISMLILAFKRIRD